ncbi:MAG: energy transducer TonB [Saprospiraceae bacterium]
MSTNPYHDDKRLLELLERWRSGEFSRANEQELQALANSDDFRRETVEGFWSLPESDHEKHLASLRIRLRERAGYGRRVVFPQFLAAAAAIGLLVLAAIWLIPNAEKIAPLAQNETKNIAEDQSVASNLPPETMEQKDKQTNGVPTLKRLSESAPGKPSSPTLDAAPAASGAASELVTAPPAALKVEGPPTDQLFASKPLEEETASEGPSVEKDDEEKEFGQLAARSEARKDSTAPGQARDSMKKKASTSANASQPKGGWDNFRDYLRRNARLPESARQNNVTGKVRLKFRLDEKSQPFDFQTLQSLGHGCDEEAIRLIKAYSWQVGSNRELILDVPFVR